METIYNEILKGISQNKKLLAILLDPDKFSNENVSGFIKKVNSSRVSHIFVGGSTVEEHATNTLVLELKTHTNLPIIIFPGDISQITNHANAILFLSLISGRNPEYLIGKHVAAISELRGTNLEVIPTGYILIENGKETAVQRVSQTEPMPREPIQDIVDTAKAGELLGMKLIYLEAGSGASEPVSKDIIKRVKVDLQIPLIVGGGIKTKEQLNDAYKSGADMVVIGTAFEVNESFLKELS